MKTDLAEDLRKAIQASGLTCNSLSKKAGVGYSTLWLFLRGKRDPALSTVSRLCEVLGLCLKSADAAKQRMVTVYLKKAPPKKPSIVKVEILSTQNEGNRALRPRQE